MAAVELGRVVGEVVSRHLAKPNGGLRPRLQFALRAVILPLDEWSSLSTFDEVLESLDDMVFRQSPASGTGVGLTIAEPIFQHCVYLTLVFRIARAKTSIPAFPHVHEPSDAAVEKRAKCRPIFDIDPNLAERLTGKGLKFAL
jgi:hypothetical protein